MRPQGRSLVLAGLAACVWCFWWAGPKPCWLHAASSPPRLSKRTPRAAVSQASLDMQLAEARAEEDMNAPLMWPRAETEIMVDVMSVLNYIWARERLTFDQTPSPFGLWSLRMVFALETLAGRFGTDRPPSPWEPLVLVYDLPNPKMDAWTLQIRHWRSLAKQGPRRVENCTVAFAGTYTQRLLHTTRCDREILHMLELLTREFPRKQVLVTWDKKLAKEVRPFATVRSPAWLEKEIRAIGTARGELGHQVMLGDWCEEMEEVLDNCPARIGQAFKTGL